MRVLFVAAEAVPFAKVGGMADVVGSLPNALRQAGLDTRVVLPGYGLIPHLKHDIQPLFEFEFHHRAGSSQVKAFSTLVDGVTFYFLQGWPFIGNESSVYSDWSWDVQRFIWFNQAVMAFIWELDTRLQWRPDVVNVSDWHTALLPFLLAQERWKREWAGIASVITIHNIAYMGNNAGGFLWNAGVPGRNYNELHWFGLDDNLLGIGIAYADMVNTVSPRYAHEIKYWDAGYELAPLINHRAADLRGILNGLDVDLWNPATDRFIIQPFDSTTFAEHRPANKAHLQRMAGLPVNPQTPVFGMVTRLAAQKGLDIAIPALHQLLADTEAQFIVLGTGEAHIEESLRRLAHRYPHKVAVYLEYSAAAAQQIYAGSDVFLMPSHFEPCGMGQMIAMRYGALPLVRETGGLADTVENYDDAEGERGTGFQFLWQEPQAVLGTLRWATYTYYNRPQVWLRMQQRAMRQDFSWGKSAQAYIELYEQAQAKHS